MNKEKLGQEPAFPMDFEQRNDYQFGMSKRFYAASMAMQGLLANPNIAGQLSRQLPKSASIEECYASVVATAYSVADEMLKQENK